MFSAGVTNAENTERREPGYFVLSKTMAYDVINDNTERLRENLAVQSPEDIETFAHILKASHPDVDKLICKFGKRIVLTAEGDKLRTHFSDTLKDHGGDCDGKRHGVWKWFDTEKDPGLVAAVSGRGTGKWPKISQATWWCFESGAEPCPRVDASAQVAREISDMGTDNKAVVAGHIAKVVEGGEVVEIRDVSSTSVMINSCYDMPKTRHGLGAYACLGLGSNLIRVSSGELIAKPAYIQSPVYIKLPCPSIHTLPMDIPKHAVTCVLRRSLYCIGNIA